MSCQPPEHKALTWKQLVVVAIGFVIIVGLALAQLFGPIVWYYIAR